MPHSVSNLRRIWLCADDYGLSHGVNAAIRDLLERGRLNATSVMVVAPAFTREETTSLAAIKASAPGIAIGLHVTLTAPFQSLTGKEIFQPVSSTLRATMLRRLDTESIAREVSAQVSAFQDMFGAAPDFVDGHQHVQLFPQIRDAVVTAISEALPQAWVRQCGRLSPLAARLRRSQRAAARRTEHAAFAKPPAARGHRFQSGLCRQLRFQRKRRLCRAVSRLPARHSGARRHHVPSRFCRR